MTYCVILRTLKGESNPDRAMITSYTSFERLTRFNFMSDFIEYWVKPFDQYEEALEECKRMEL